MSKHLAMKERILQTVSVMRERDKLSTKKLFGYIHFLDPSILNIRQESSLFFSPDLVHSIFSLIKYPSNSDVFFFGMRS